SPGSYHRALHDNGVMDNGTLFYDNTGSDHRVGDFSVNLASFADDASLDLCVRSYILGRDDIALGIDTPVFFIKIKLRNDVDQFHIGFPVGAKGSHILPVSVILVGKDPLALSVAVGNDMLSEIAA